MCNKLEFPSLQPKQNHEQQQQQRGLLQLDSRPAKRGAELSSGDRSRLQPAATAVRTDGTIRKPQKTETDTCCKRFL